MRRCSVAASLGSYSSPAGIPTLASSLGHMALNQDRLSHSISYTTAEPICSRSVCQIEVALTFMKRDIISSTIITPYNCPRSPEGCLVNVVALTRAEPQASDCAALGCSTLNLDIGPPLRNWLLRSISPMQPRRIYDYE
jgi:hypothetical protein